MTTDTTELQERIERILAEHPIQPPTYAGDAPIAVKRRRAAARIAGEVAAEVRAAKTEALREAARYFAGGLHCADMRSTPEETVRELNRRATEYETGDSDEHR